MNLISGYSESYQLSNGCISSSRSKGGRALKIRNYQDGKLEIIKMENAKVEEFRKQLPSVISIFFCN